MSALAWVLVGVGVTVAGLAVTGIVIGAVVRQICTGRKTWWL